MSVENQNTKFSDPYTTAEGKQRAWVDLTALKTLWFNTGTLCNLACVNCYIESTPKNDSLVYLILSEVVEYLDEIIADKLPTEEIGITGGEPFMNPDIIPIMEIILKRGFKLLVLTNAMRPMMKCQEDLLRLKDKYGAQMTMRISVDHFKRRLHEEERGARSWGPMMKGLQWLSDNEFTIDIAGRTRWGENDLELRNGFGAFFKEHNIRIDAHDIKQLMLLPEMDENIEVSEITTACWDILSVSPDNMMCASSRMVVKHKGDKKPSVMACTLLAYDQQFNMGKTLKKASKSVHLNHPHCAKFCVLGGGACSVSE
ncbi:MAG: radical SAM protein [Zetaproteobacteria bacterium]|nr:MAG: radical SAM protein [Zetaproteobacteria bacterium]